MTSGCLCRCRVASRHPDSAGSVLSRRPDVPATSQRRARARRHWPSSIQRSVELIHLQAGLLHRRDHVGLSLRLHLIGLRGLLRGLQLGCGLFLDGLHCDVCIGELFDLLVGDRRRSSSAALRRPFTRWLVLPQRVTDIPRPAVRALAPAPMPRGLLRRSQRTARCKLGWNVIS